MKSFTLVLFTFYYICFQTNASVQFTNIVCIPKDETFAAFEYCYIKAVNRTYKYISLKVKLFDLPVSNVTVNIAILKKANGYKPFLFNVTQDGCSFLKNRKNVVARYLHDLFKDYSNMNHTCPFNHDLIVEKLPISHMDNALTQILPMPRGEYLFDSFWFAYNKLRANVRVFFTLS